MFQNILIQEVMNSDEKAVLYKVYYNLKSKKIFKVDSVVSKLNGSAFALGAIGSSLNRLTKDHEEWFHEPAGNGLGF